MLQAAGLAAFRGERLVFSEVDFAVRAGGMLLLTGPNGSGKSTLLRLLAGLLRPAAGMLTWAGANVFADLSAHVGRVAYVGHQDAVKPGLTAAENLRFVARLGEDHQAGVRVEVDETGRDNHARGVDLTRGLRVTLERADS